MFAMGHKWSLCFTFVILYALIDHRGIVWQTPVSQIIAQHRIAANVPFFIASKFTLGIDKGEYAIGSEWWLQRPEYSENVIF